ncbi:MAG: pyruvate, water dikinase, partial [Bacillota bacterium]
PHGARGARELGSPGVCTGPGVRAALRVDDTVTVNGNEGTVVRH